MANFIVALMTIFRGTDNDQLDHTREEEEEEEEK
jgi:hypothetical protein